MQNKTDTKLSALSAVKMNSEEWINV